MFPAVTALLCAAVVGLRAELLNATVGASLLILCELPAPLNLQWFYWQEDGTENILIDCNQICVRSEKYKNRVTVFESEFSSGNISIRLHGVTAADDGRSFWVFARYKVGANTEETCEHCCNSTLQVSAPYRDLNLTIDAADAATCTARGGYPESSVSWCGRHKADGECVDLHGAKTAHEENPKDGTFTVTSSISVKELVSVTCHVVNLHSNKNVSRSTRMDGDSAGADPTLAILIPVLLLLLLLIIIIIRYLYKKCCKSGNEADGGQNGGGGNDAGEGNELQERPGEGRTEGSEHQSNTDQTKEAETLLGAAGGENLELRPAGDAQSQCSSGSTPRRRGSPRSCCD